MHRVIPFVCHHQLQHACTHTHTPHMNSAQSDGSTYLTPCNHMLQPQAQLCEWKCTLSGQHNDLDTGRHAARGTFEWLMAVPTLLCNSNTAWQQQQVMPRPAHLRWASINQHKVRPSPAMQDHQHQHHASIIGWCAEVCRLHKTRAVLTKQQPGQHSSSTACSQSGSTALLLCSTCQEHAVQYLNRNPLTP